MKKTRWKKIRKVLLIVLAFYIGCGLVLYFFQEKILFHPVPLPADHRFSFDQPFREVNVPINETTNLSIIQFTVPDSLRKGVVLYFHGNRRNVERYAPFATNFTRNNYEVWMADYPGFGKSTGTRTERSLYYLSSVVYKMARAKFGKDSIVIYGKSIGTGIAAQLASVSDCKQLILETPYYSIDALLGHYAFIYPVRSLSHYHLPSYQYFSRIEVPITLFHGTRDEVIPYGQASRLVEKNPRARLITIENGRHNNLPDYRLYQQTLDSLLR